MYVYILSIYPVTYRALFFSITFLPHWSRYDFLVASYDFLMHTQIGIILLLDLCRKSNTVVTLNS